jgi:hypothetical protein
VFAVIAESIELIVALPEQAIDSEAEKGRYYSVFNLALHHCVYQYAS